MLPRFLPLVALATLLAAHVSAQDRPTVGTILVAHGDGEEWNRQVIDAAAAAHTGGPVEVAFLMGPGAAAHRFQDAAARLEAVGVREIAVVPLLVSSHSGHYQQIRYLAGETDSLGAMMMHHLAMAGIERALVHVPMHVTAALDAEAVRRIREIIALQAALTGKDVVVVPLLVSRGRASREKFMAELAGLPVVYSGDPLLPHPAITRWIERRVGETTIRAATSPTPAPSASYIASPADTRRGPR